MRKRVLIMMTALAMTTTAIPATAMTAYADTIDTAEGLENEGEGTQSEEAKKKAAEEAKKKAEEEAKKKAEEEAQRQAEEEARRAAEEEAQRQAEEEARRAAEEEAQRQAEEEARRAAEEEAQRQAEEEARRAAEEEAQRQAEEKQNFDIDYTWTEKTEEDKYICTATAVTEDGTVLTETSEATLEEIPATCEEAGQDIYTAVFTNPVFETQIKTVEIPATGHLFVGEPIYIWNDEANSCTATRTCEIDGYVETETVTVRMEMDEPTCTAAGLVRYIAEFTNPAFTAQMKKEEIPATGHRFAEPTYRWNNADNTCTATRVCEKDGYTETETVTASSAVILEPTSTETGIRRYIAEFTNPAFTAQMKKEEIPATGKKSDDNKKKNNDKKENNKKDNTKKEETKKNDSSKKKVTTTAVKKTTTQNQNTAQTTKTAPVKTGDSTQPIIPIAAGTGALAAIAAIIMKLRRNRG